MEVHDDLLTIDEELLWLAGSFSPGSTSLPDVLLDFGNTSIGTSCWKAFGFDANNLRIKVSNRGVHIVAIYCFEEFFECFDFVAHWFHAELTLLLMAPGDKALRQLDRQSIGEEDPGRYDTPGPHARRL